MGAYAEAESLFLAAHELDPSDATYLIYAFSAASARGDLSRAEELIRRALECQEGCLDEAYFNLGGCLLRKKQYEEARRCYVQALEIDPDYEIAKKRLADLDALRERQRDQSGAAPPDDNPQ
jgi:tetratricopeptide (TPR) repeat protein